MEVLVLIFGIKGLDWRLNLYIWDKRTGLAFLVLNFRKNGIVWCLRGFISPKELGDRKPCDLARFLYIHPLD